VRIIDSTFDKLNEGIITPDSLKWRDLNNQKLSLKSSARLAARWLYFHYCLQILQRAWKVGPGEKVALGLYSEFGEYVWATPGRYIGKKMLRALIESRGQENRELLRGSSTDTRDADAFLDCMTQQISTTPMMILRIQIDNAN
jgi:hypothetical protein